VHEDLERRVTRLGLVRPRRVKHLNEVTVFFAEPDGAAGDQGLEPTCVLVKRGRLVLRVVLALSLVDQERDVLDGNVSQDFLECVDERGLPARDHGEPIVVHEKAGLREKIGVALLGAKNGQDLCASRLDDAVPDLFAQRSQRSSFRSDDQLQFLFGSLEEARRDHAGAHDAHMCLECKRRGRLLA